MRRCPLGSTAKVSRSPRCLPTCYYLPTYPPLTTHYSLQDGVEGAGGIVTITAECDRYLYNMMRIVSGTLVEVGLGRLDVAGVASLLATEDRGALQDKGGPRVYKVRPHRRPRATRRNCSAPLVAACHLPAACLPSA